MSARKYVKSVHRGRSQAGRGRSGPRRANPRLATQRQSGAYQARSSRGVVARAARAMLNQRTAGFLGVEKKFFDTALPPTNIASSATFVGAELNPTLPGGAAICMSCPSQGDGPQNRDGKKFVVKSAQIKGFIDIPAQTAGAPVAGNKVFVALVLDTQCNTVAAVAADIFSNLSADARMGVLPTRNLLFGKRFRILKSEVFDLNLLTLAWRSAPGGTGDTWGNQGRSVCFEWYVPLNLQVNCNASSSSTFANISDNSLNVIAIAAAAGGSNQATLTYNARIRFMG